MKTKADKFDYIYIMKQMCPVLILLLSFTLSAFGQPDSGFTDKQDAKNQTVNGLKEGKWCEYIKLTAKGKGDNMKVSEMVTTHKRRAAFYRLTVYKDGKPDGMMRTYYTDGSPEGEVMFVNGRQNGVARIFYSNGKIAAVNPFTDGKINGVRKAYGDNGQLVLADTVTSNSEDGLVILYDTNGRINIEILFSRDTLKGGTITIPRIKTVLNHEKTTAIKQFYPDGKLKSMTVYNSASANGVSKQYDENGNEIK